MQKPATFDDKLPRDCPTCGRRHFTWEPSAASYALALAQRTTRNTTPATYSGPKIGLL
jgi:hypothetical protein